MNFKSKFCKNYFSIKFFAFSPEYLQFVHALLHTFSMQKNAKDKYVKHLRSNS